MAKTIISVSLEPSTAELLEIHNIKNVSNFIEHLIISELEDVKKRAWGEFNRAKRELELAGYDIELNITERGV